MSGSVTANWVINANPRKQASKLSGLLNCPQNNTRQMISCLKLVSPEAITDKFNAMRVNNVLGIMYSILRMFCLFIEFVFY